MSESTPYTPIYLQLRELLRHKIEDGELPPGTAIPSENSLANQYDINRLTVRNAVDTLVQEGLLKRVHGKGVFVVGTKLSRDLDTLGGFTQTMIDKNQTPSTKILIKTLRRAGTHLAETMLLGPAEGVFYIKRVCYSNAEPFSLEEIYIPQKVIPTLEAIDLSVFSLYEVYELYGIELIEARQTLDMTTLSQKDSRKLSIKAGDPVFFFRCVSYDNNGQAVELARTYTRSDKCVFTVNFASELSMPLSRQ